MPRPHQSPAAWRRVGPLSQVGLCRLLVAAIASLALAGLWHGATPRPIPRSPLSTPCPSLPALTAPTDIVARAQERAAAEPERSREFAYAAIAALHAAGRSADAAAFATDSSLGPRRDLVIAAYFEWGQRAPDTALQQAFAVAEPSTREFALEAVFSGWAKNNPAGLAQTAAHFPEGSERVSALTKALRYWSIQDPGAAEDWITANASVLPAAEHALRED